MSAKNTQEDRKHVILTDFGKALLVSTTRPSISCGRAACTTSNASGLVNITNPNPRDLSINNTLHTVNNTAVPTTSILHCYQHTAMCLAHDYCYLKLIGAEFLISVLVFVSRVLCFCDIEVGSK